MVLSHGYYMHVLQMRLNIFLGDTSDGCQTGKHGKKTSVVTCKPCDKTQSL
jgi:hypothetical protein